MTKLETELRECYAAWLSEIKGIDTGELFEKFCEMTNDKTTKTRAYWRGWQAGRKSAGRKRAKNM